MQLYMLVAEYPDEEQGFTRPKAVFSDATEAERHRFELQHSISNTLHVVELTLDEAIGVHDFYAD